jgi:(E)-4-hydroxy-3-methylbut-2-enyl-diphosphate synthase
LKSYCESTLWYKRIKTKEVHVGDVVIGGLHPLVVQSMTNTDTDDIVKTVDQIMELADVGCEIVRVTAPSIRSAENLEKIVNLLRAKNYTVPIVADIHFTPNAAMKAAEFVEKIRINPGNFVDKKKFEILEYTNEQYQDELKRIEDKFIPFIEVVKKYNRAIRIGTNHGSLSDRIMNRYGDTASGMVESAFEFAKICEENQFENFLFSMKASNPQVMIEAYRLLQARMIENNEIYPLHLGVTEAGDGEDGRIKSFIGINSLLADGLGDTIRVSLTESPIKEIPVAKQIANFFNNYVENQKCNIVEKKRSFFEYKKRNSTELSELFSFEHDFFPVFASHSKKLSTLTAQDLSAIEKPMLTDDQCADKIILNLCDLNDLSVLKTIMNDSAIDKKKLLISIKEISLLEEVESLGLEIAIPSSLASKVKSNNVKAIDLEFSRDNWKDELLEYDFSGLDENILIYSSQINEISFYRILNELNLKNPILVSYFTSKKDNNSSMLAATVAGAALCDGIGNGILIQIEDNYLESLTLSYNILQACRLRMSKTEYISCPSCGRTLFDLEETTAEIKKYTGHLKGVKIAVMGCIVNGPGEMADADFGYVGSGPGKINLYVGKNLVKRNINSKDAVKELIELMKTHDMWLEEVYA